MPNIRRVENQSRTKGLAERKKLEKELSPNPKRLVAPKWLSPEARVIFERTKHQLRGLGLLGSVDADMLAIYSDAVAKYPTAQTPSEQRQWARMALAFGEKLGISVDARLRMARKITPAVSDFEKLLDDVTDFMNEGGKEDGQE